MNMCFILCNTSIRMIFITYFFFFNKNCSHLTHSGHKIKLNNRSTLFQFDHTSPLLLFSHESLYDSLISIFKFLSPKFLIEIQPLKSSRWWSGASFFSASSTVEISSSSRNSQDKNLQRWQLIEVINGFKCWIVVAAC